MKKYKKQVAKPFLEYDYDEDTDQVSEITEDDKHIILPYIPDAVKNEIDKKRRKQNQQDDSSDDELLNKINKKIQSYTLGDGGKVFVYKKKWWHD